MRQNRPDINTDQILALAGNYANARNTAMMEAFSARPLSVLRQGIDRFLSRRYSECVRIMVDKILSQQASNDFHHMALCYIARSYARSGDIESAETVLAETDRIQVPAGYLATARSLVEDVRKDIETMRAVASRRPHPTAF
mgnify:CR=1 FL=1